MTARRRRKSGSGPSATALIAWVGGSRTRMADDASTPASTTSRAAGDRLIGGRAILFGRACGLAAGTLLACGSVLVGATHVGDGSLTTDSSPLLNSPPDLPAGTAGAPVEFGEEAPAEPAPAAPDPVSAQAVTEPRPVVAPRLGPIRRNAPVSVDMPAQAPQHPDMAPRQWSPPSQARDHAPETPTAPIGPVLDPATREVGRVAPVGGGVLPSTNPSTRRAGSQFATPGDKQTSYRRDEPAKASSLGAVETVNKVVTPVENTIAPVLEPVTTQPLIQPAAQPAMAMLTSLLPIG